MIARVVTLLLVVTAGGTAGTIATQVECWYYNPPGGFGTFQVQGTFSASCNTTFFDHNFLWPEHETATVNPGIISTAQTSHDPNNGGFAEADFSAQYVFTLTGADKLFDFGPGYGLGAFVLPCLTATDQGRPFDYRTVASLGGSLGGVVQYFNGSTCPSGSRIPALLNQPMTMQLTLDAYSGGWDAYGGVGNASAAFSGFMFFDSYNGGNPMNATYTFTLQDQLIPEPGSLFLVAPVILLWPVLRLRTRKP
jgi:hypothetical protein